MAPAWQEITSRAAQLLLDDDAIEFDDPMGWQPLIHELPLTLLGRADEVIE
jgi:hypothetical protein